VRQINRISDPVFYGRLIGFSDALLRPNKAFKAHHNATKLAQHDSEITFTYAMMAAIKKACTRRM
jgi:hypothetical protein